MNDFEVIIYEGYDGFEIKIIDPSKKETNVCISDEDDNRAKKLKAVFKVLGIGKIKIKPNY